MGKESSHKPGIPLTTLNKFNCCGYLEVAVLAENL